MTTHGGQMLAEKRRCRAALERIADSLEYLVDWLERAENFEDKLFKKNSNDGRVPLE